MGAWGVGIFDNDTACDWAYDLEKASGLSFIEQTIEAVFENEFIDAGVGEQALATIDTLARLKGNFAVRNYYTKTVDNWVAQNKLPVSGELLNKADKAITHLLGSNSGLLEL